MSEGRAGASHVGIALTWLIPDRRIESVVDQSDT